MRTLGRLRRCLLAVSCVGVLPAADAAAKKAPASAPAETAAKASAPPEGYWIVVTSEGDPGLVGGAFHFRKDGWDFVGAKGKVMRQDTKWIGDGHRWKEAGAAPDLLTLERRDADLVLSYLGGGGQAHLQPAPAARAAELAQALGQVAAPADACRRAEACCKKAMPLLGTTCDVAFQLGDRSTSTCTNSVKGMQMLLAEKKIPIPSECK